MTEKTNNKKEDEREETEDGRWETGDGKWKSRDERWEMTTGNGRHGKMDWGRETKEVAE